MYRCNRGRERERESCYWLAMVAQLASGLGGRMTRNTFNRWALKKGMGMAPGKGNEDDT